MDPQFGEIFSRPENQIFGIVFFPDRIYHAEYFNATTSERYRYYVSEVRDKYDITVLTGQVYLDGQLTASILRIEYRATRLLEQTRERNRLPGPRVRARLKLRWRPPPPLVPKPIAVERFGELHDIIVGVWPGVDLLKIESWLKLRAITVNGVVAGAATDRLGPSDVVELRGDRLTTAREASAFVTLHFSPTISAWQVELWSNLETTPSNPHDVSVSVQIGSDGPISSHHRLAPALADGARIASVQLSFFEARRSWPLAEIIGDPQIDDFYGRMIQVPNSPQPSSAENTIAVGAYELDFQRGWVLDANAVTPVRYNNALIEQAVDGQNNPDFGKHNIVEMKWLLQQELGSSLVYFHEVTIPPGAIEGSHQHIGSEELYYIFEGNGVAYMGASDDADLDSAPFVETFVFGFGPRRLRQVPVRPGSVIFTKSGGMHGIRNPNMVPLRFVAFGYHTR